MQDSISFKGKSTAFKFIAIIITHLLQYPCPNNLRIIYDYFIQIIYYIQSIFVVAPATCK